ncbi:MAG: ROK family protein [Verrucomicrobiota bacterium]
MRTKGADQSALQGQALLHLRSRRASSRSSLAQALDVSPSTAGLHVDHLIAAGFLEDSGREQGAMGRPKRTLSLRPDAGWFAGVELTAERVQSIQIDFSGNILAKHLEFLPSHPNAEDTINTIINSIKNLDASQNSPLLGVGLGAPGLVDPQKGLALDHSLIRNWTSVPITQILSHQFHTPVILENNLRAVAIAERWFGAGKHLEDYVIIGARSGFGIAMVQNGRLTRGAHLAAGEIGRWPWPLNGANHKGTLEDHLSAPAAYRRLAGLSNRGRLPVDLHTALARQADTTGRFWNRLVSDYARVVGLIHFMLDADTCYLHGPLTALGPRFCDDVAAAMPNAFPHPKNAPIRFTPSTLGDNAGALGAASLAMEAYIPSTD